MITDAFQQVLDHIRSASDSESEKGRLFERLMKTYFQQDPVYQGQFRKVWLWSEWASSRPDFDGVDIGIDLVAEESEGGYCAIQCKCYAPGTRISKQHLDSFISASAREPFTGRIVVDTGDTWGANAKRTIDKLTPACRVLHFGDLANQPVHWPDLLYGKPEDLSVERRIFQLRPHQQEAFDAVTAGFNGQDRGKLIMACGTGKTFTALRIAESVAEVGGRVLFLVPSISLLQQAMREWAEQRTLPHRYIGICSDTRAGRTDEDASLQELEIPVTTDPEAISQALLTGSNQTLTVVFCTYHSLELVQQAQKQGAPPFDLILCDEAHRTTGVDRPGDTTSPFVLVHDADCICAKKRLYMTATPRLYTASAKTKAAVHDIEVFSMDDPETYGQEFHRLPFSRAVEQNLLSDYKVLVLAISEQQADPVLQAHLASKHSEINLSDTAKIVGSWRALLSPENTSPGQEGHVPPLRRAIAFTNTIKSSKQVEKHWESIITHAMESMAETAGPEKFHCEVRHVDGQHNALDRKSRIDWLKGDEEGVCRILSNARCLSEGIDVPSLDAVLFLSARKSHIDIVQAVGRTMRKAPGKKYGYILLPIAIPPGLDPAVALDDNKTYDVVWSVLQALRSHDDRLDAEINQMDLNKQRSKRILPRGLGLNEQEKTRHDQHTLDLFTLTDLPADAFYAKIVEKCGDRKYWETWAGDVADIFSRLKTRIQGLLDNPDNADLLEWFESFHGELQASINESIRPESAIEMMAQHILTRPVFEALFTDYDFAGGNPVARALDTLRNDFGEFGLDNETRDMEKFYESVRNRARGLDNSAARQRVLMELYEKFFATAMKKDADRLGIVYTPVEIVDFILASADSVLHNEFGRSLSDEGVHILDPFTGTGIFLVRLLQSALIRGVDLTRKYREELHANEIVLLAYYIAAIHIEEAFQGRTGLDSSYEPFTGIILTDTFNLHDEKTVFPKDWLPNNSARAERQQELPIQVIVGNPPWSAGQKSSADDNPNVNYPELERRIASTYATRSTSTNKNSLYDTYKMAIRWASDRVGEQGVIALVTNGSWIDGNVDSGVRACLAEEFSTVYVLNLRGNQRTQGERSRREGGKVFGQGSRAPVAITVLVRNPDADQDGCRILYRDIGDYLKREEKLSILRDAGSIAGIEDWREITPDRHHDWIGQRDEAFQAFYPMGTKSAKTGKDDDAIFRLYSNGYYTGKDPYIYNFSHENCINNGKLMTIDYCTAFRELKRNPDFSTERVISNYSKNCKWDATLKSRLKSGLIITFSQDHIRKVTYRPFVRTYCYADDNLSKRPAIRTLMFPERLSKNRAICVPGVGSTKPSSVLMVNTMPDLELISKGQCFPRYRYQKASENQDEVFDQPTSERFDNISDTALRRFQAHYQDNTITKDAIFDYVYGILHEPDYRKRFANDLSKDIPRIPMTKDFHVFATAGAQLAALHLGYETGQEYPLEMVCTPPGASDPEHYRLGRKAMKYANVGQSELIINEHIRLQGIPPEAHRYEVNGRTPLGWFIDRYKIKTDTHSGILNDANEWFEDPRNLVTAIRRIVQVSVETVGIVEGLPKL